MPAEQARHDADRHFDDERIQSYVNDAVQLRLLDLERGESVSLVDDRAVNVEPRWSPSTW